MQERKPTNLSGAIAGIHGNQQVPSTFSAALPSDSAPTTTVPNGKRFMTTAELSRPREEGEINLAQPLLTKMDELGLMSKYVGALPKEFIKANPQYQRHLFNLATRIIIGELAQSWFHSDDSIESTCDLIDSTLTQGADFNDHNLWLTSVLGVTLPKVAEMVAAQSALQAKAEVSAPTEPVVVQEQEPVQEQPQAVVEDEAQAQEEPSEQEG